MKKNIFKTTLLSIALLAGNGLVAAEAGEDIVKLQSNDGQEFEVPVSVAQRLGALTGVIEFAGTENSIPLPNVNSATLALIIPLLGNLNNLLLHNAKVAPEKQLYIPRWFQRVVNEVLQNQPNEQLGELLHATDYLDLDNTFILNAVAAVIADRIHAKVTLENLTLDQQLQAVAQQLEKDAFGQFPNEIVMYVLKHVTCRKKGISQEYSIADYIREHGQPALVDKPLVFFGDSRPTIDLRDIRITSLFGIQSLQDKGQMQNLDVENNCFFDFGLDVQGVAHPFENMPNLKGLKLNYNKLTSLPEGLFNGLANLQWLGLYGNQLDRQEQARIIKALNQMKARMREENPNQVIRNVLINF